MAHLTTQEACHTFPLVKVDYTAEGTWSEKGLGGLKTYSKVSEPRSKKAILVIYDIFGFCEQNYQVVDLLAGQGYDVYLPDVRSGHTLDSYGRPLLEMTPEEQKETRRKFDTEFPGSIPSQLAPVRGLIEELKKKGYEKVAGLGFCWGANVIVQVPEFDALILTHPGAAVNPDNAAKLHSPTCLMPSQNENEENMEGFHKVMLSQPVGDKCELVWFKDQPHGWMSNRADLNTEKGKEGFQKGMDTMINFLTKHF